MVTRPFVSRHSGWSRCRTPSRGKNVDGAKGWKLEDLQSSGGHQRLPGGQECRTSPVERQRQRPANATINLGPRAAYSRGAPGTGSGSGQPPSAQRSPEAIDPALPKLTQPVESSGRIRPRAMNNRSSNPLDGHLLVRVAPPPRPGPRHGPVDPPSWVQAAGGKSARPPGDLPRSRAGARQWEWHQPNSTRPFAPGTP